MSEQIRVNIINTLIGTLIGMSTFIVAAAFAPYLVVLPLILTFALMKYLEIKWIKEYADTNIIMPIMWIISSIYLLYMLNKDGFMYGDRISTAVMISLILFLSFVPITIYMGKNKEYISKTLNMLPACIVWSIIVYMLHILDIPQNDFLRGMSIMLMIFPYSIILFNIKYERTMLYYENKKK